MTCEHKTKAKDKLPEDKAKALDCKMCPRILEAKDMSSRTPSLILGLVSYS